MLLPDGTVSTRGILMGRPGTKIVLMLHNLCAEYYAYWCWLGKPQDISQTSIHRQKPWWRNFSAAGDDHVALGPVMYLDQLAEVHIKNGLALNPEKHGYTISPNPRIGKFCEKLIYGSNKTVWAWNGTKEYLRKPFVDSLKCRLLSTATKASESRELTNPWPGKAKALNQEVEWLRECGEFEAICLLSQMVMKVRMNRFMPKSRIFALPPEWGGLGLGIRGQNYLDILEDLTPNHRSAIALVLGGKASKELISALRSFRSDRYARGVQLDYKAIETAAVVAGSSQTYSFADAWEILRSEGKLPETTKQLRFVEKEDLLERHGFGRLTKILAAVERSSLMQQLLVNPETVGRGFRREAPWHDRIALLELKLEVAQKEVGENRLDSGALQSLSEVMAKADPRDIEEVALSNLWLSTQESGGWNSRTDRGRPQDNSFWGRYTTTSQLLLRNLSLLPTLTVKSQKLETLSDKVSRNQKARVSSLMDSAAGTLRATWNLSKVILRAGIHPGAMAKRRQGYGSKRDVDPLEDKIVKETWNEFSKLTHLEEDVRSDEYAVILSNSKSDY